MLKFNKTSSVSRAQIQILVSQMWRHIFHVEKQADLYVCLFVWRRLNCFFLIWKADLEDNDLLTTTATMD